MKRLIITTDGSSSGLIKEAVLADGVIGLEFMFIWAPHLPLPDLTAFLSAQLPRDESISHWTDVGLGRRLGEKFRRGTALADVCKDFDEIDLWASPDPTDQLKLAGLLDYLGSHENIASKLKLRQADQQVAEYGSETFEMFRKWRSPAIKIEKRHLEIASATWRAFCAPTPQGWLDLLTDDLSPVPYLRQAANKWLDELPMPVTGLGATEIRLLEIISKPHDRKLGKVIDILLANDPHVYGSDACTLLDRLSEGPSPAVVGIKGGPWTAVLDGERRGSGYLQSRLSLTEFGKALCAETEDFTRHNPIDRWWGGVHLTNENLWRWDPVRRKLIAP